MKKAVAGRFFWKLFLGNALLLILVVGSAVWLIVGAFERFYVEELKGNLRTLAVLVRDEVKDQFDIAHAEQLDRFCAAIHETHPNGVRVTLVKADGTVLADSDADSAKMESHADRVEIIQALTEGSGSSTRFSQTFSRDMVYVAVRVGEPGAPLGVVRVSMAVRSVAARTQLARRLFWTLALVVTVAAIALALGLARLWSRPLSDITQAARSLSRGDLTAQVEVRGSDELTLLSLSLNRMRNNIAGQVQTIDRQRRSLELLLAQLHEGVIVANAQGRIRLLNPAASILLGIRPPRATEKDGFIGLPIDQCVSDPDLRNMLMPPGRKPAEGADSTAPAEWDSSASLAGESIIVERRLLFDRPEGTVSLLARASDIMLPRLDRPRTSGKDAAAAEPPAENGRLLVLTDITELTRAMQMKVDFAANASHELRTPLAAIRAAVETMASIDPAEDPTSSSQFLKVIDRHSARLEEMVADLLDLSRLESPSARFQKTQLQLDEVLADLHARFADKLERKKIDWRCHVAEDAHGIAASRHLLRLILDNLVHNAIKFTEQGGHIVVACRRDNGAVFISVEDDGCGIPPEDHARVFERFYQVERARSGVKRGTGLGLSIVRHAVMAMEGGIDLQSAPGRGTLITIRLPQPPHE